MFKNTYSADIEINASSEKVWQTLVQTADYHLWNTFTPVVDLDWKIGSPVVMKVQMNPGKKPLDQTETLCEYQAPVKIAWEMNWPLPLPLPILLKAKRTQEVIRIDDSRCIYKTVDTIQGLLAPIVDLLYGKHIQNGFERVATGIKEYVETNSDKLSSED